MEIPVLFSVISHILHENPRKIQKSRTEFPFVAGPFGILRAEPGGWVKGGGGGGGNNGLGSADTTLGGNNGVGFSAPINCLGGACGIPRTSSSNLKSRTCKINVSYKFVLGVRLALTWPSP